jgi:hypothetical protein
MGRPPASPLSMDSIIFSTPVLPAPPVSCSKSMGVSHYDRIRQRKIIALCMKELQEYSTGDFPRERDATTNSS